MSRTKDSRVRLLSRRVAQWVRAVFVEWRSRRAGRRHAPAGTASAARDITGPLGAAWSSTYNQLEQHGSAYLKSFDRHLPPSLYVSERDRLRHGDAIPVAERAIADWRTDNRTDEVR